MPDYFESGFFYKEPAWHKLGNVIQEKVYDTKEAIRLAGQDWTVSKVPLFADYDSKLLPYEGRYAIVRDDNKAVLGDCSERYSLIQNSELFSFFDPFLHERDVFITTAGVLHGGRVVWALAEIEGLRDHEVIEGDTVQSRILLASSHDRSMSTTVKFVHERVVCANTLAVAMNEGGAFKTIRHTGDVRKQMSEIQGSIDIFKRSFEDKIDTYRELTRRDWTHDTMVSYLEKLYESDLAALYNKRLDEGEDTYITVDDLRSTKTILNNFHNTEDLQVDGVRGTAYAAFNAVSEYITHQKSSNMDTRLNAVWFGSDGNFLAKAEELALAM